ncbi:MAG: HTH-type transcriptional regulator CysB [Nevskia sp.]|jgi:LysR family cys regulon transcriptional activator|uniref:HTH-type transcriptional regulator CysB n=1 Tax=Nevskia sp. TaxID=1929292 RepID=UPI0040355211
MKLRQLHYVMEISKRGLSVTAAAEALFTSQPGVSKQVRLLEEELGVDIFVRNGKHISEITPAGKRILEYTRRLLLEADNIRNIASEFRTADRGDLSVATTHTQARYALPPVIGGFRKAWPSVALHLHQGSPPQIAKQAVEGAADFAIATEALEHFDDLVMLPCYHWNRSILVPPDHPLAHQFGDRPQALTLAEIAAYPVITYTFGFTGRSKLDQAFAAQGLRPDVVLTAVDADVIKTYVRLGLGIGIVASMSHDETLDSDLVSLPVDHLFEQSTTHIGFRQGMFLRGFMFDFIQRFAPHLTREVVETVAAIQDPEQRRRLVAERFPTLQKR